MKSFVTWLMSPLAEWHVVSLQHKLIVGAAGAGAAWYLHSYKKWPTWKVALGAFGVAYGTSAVLNAARRFAVPAGLPPMPPTQLIAGAPVYPQPAVVPPGTPQPAIPVVPSVSNVGPLDLGVQGQQQADSMEEDEGFAGDDGIFS